MEFIKEAAKHGGVELERDHVVRLIISIGEALLLSGAEISRVEDTIERLGHKYGAVSVECFTITSSIMLTMEFDDTFNVSHVRRIKRSPSTNFTRIEQINNLSRAYCSDEITIEELEEKFLEVCSFKKTPYFKLVQYIGSALVTSGAAVFFGGTMYDGLVAGIMGLIVFLLQDKVEPICSNTMIFNMISTFLTGTIIMLSARMMPFLHADMIISGEIMLLIPGIPFTISIRDIITGDTLSGSLRLIESLAWAVALAAGYMLAIILFS